MAKKKKFYVTTPIYYVNDKPHIGHAYTTILADVLARYHRLLGVPTWFLTGTDEHGQKVKQAAEKVGLSPKEQADSTVVRFQELWKKLDITHDDFIRTTEPRHTVIVQKILQDLYERGEIYKAEYDGWYDLTSETFVTDKDLQEGEQPPNIIRIQETNYFFRMGKYQEWLIDYIEKNPTFIQPDYRRNETLGFLRRKLNDLCISRPKKRMDWGIELPFDKDFVTYVWFDALVNYISAIGYLDHPKTFDKWWPVSMPLIGKDILTTHTVYWPTMLKAMGLPMPEMIFAHGWWLSGTSKMSKSLGNVVNPMDMIDRYGVDAFRYFLIAEMSLGQDASFTEEAFVRRFNSDLANDLGNLVSRVVTMVQRNCEGRIPELGDDVLNRLEENALWQTAQDAVHSMEKAVTGMRLDNGVADVISVVRATNRYLEKRQPWTLAKQEDKSELHIVLFTAAEVLRVVSGLLYPVMPEKMTELRQALGIATLVPEFKKLQVWGGTASGTVIAGSFSLFPRIQDDKKPAPVPEVKAPAKTSGTSKKEDKPVQISYEEFSRVQLRTAKILSAERIPDANKLLRLEVMMGEERRQLVAGIALHYEPEKLIGKTVVVVANLEPATIRGVESNGMILAATRGESLRLITIDGEQSSGAIVK